VTEITLLSSSWPKICRDSVNGNNCLGAARRAHNRIESVLLSRYLENLFVTFDAVGASNTP
jgi:hypothetical protein